MRIANVEARAKVPTPHMHNITIPHDATHVVVVVGRLQGGVDNPIGVITFEVVSGTPEDIGTD